MTKTLAAICAAILFLASSATARSQQRQTLRAMAEPSIVQVEVDFLDDNNRFVVRQTGTGFVISQQGHILTVAHTFSLDNAGGTSARVGTIRVRLPQSPDSSHSAKLVKTDQQVDLAILSVEEGLLWPPLCFGRSTNSKVGAPLVSLGFSPVTKDKSYLVEQLGKLESLSGDAGRWVTSIKTGPGFSGAPVFDAEQKVIGILWGAYKINTSINLVIPEGYSDAFRKGIAVEADQCDELRRKIASDRKTAEDESRTRFQTLQADAQRNLARDVQKGLKKVGCYDGPVDGVWGEGSIAGLKRFSEKSQERLPLNQPSDDALRAIEKHGDQKVCVVNPLPPTPPRPDATSDSFNYRAARSIDCGLHVQISTRNGVMTCRGGCKVGNVPRRCWWN